MKKKKSALQRFQHTLLLLTHVAAFLGALLPYQLIMGQRYWPLLRISRTLAVTVLAFLMAYIFMSRIYGGFDIGKRKSKPIIYSQIAALLFTDLVAQVFLSVMLSNETSDNRFRLANFWLMLLAYVVQVLVLIGLTYGFNALYFRINAPANCLLVSQKGADYRSFVKEIQKFRKQFHLTRMVDYRHPELKRLIEQNDTIFFYGLTPEEREAGVLHAYRKKKDIYYSLNLSDIVALRGQTVYYSDKSLIASPEHYMSFEQRCIKRAGDLFLSTLALVILSPVFLITALAIKLEDGGPVFYRQERVTFGGRIFEVLKFRSMRVNADADKVQATKDDPRKTKWGNIMRKTNIDELPQFINVLLGDMSIVGPRPHMVKHTEEYGALVDKYMVRHYAKPGITGWAQVTGSRGETSELWMMEERIKKDIWYVENWSLLLDIKIIIKTVTNVFGGETGNAY